MPLGGSSALAWVVTVGFLVAFVVPVLYLTHLSVRDDTHAEAASVESTGPES